MRARLKGWLKLLRRPRVLAAAGLVGLLPLGALSAHVGWYSHARAWQAATGWDLIPADERPDERPLWKASTGDRSPPVLRWLGHSGFLVEWKGERLLLDPNVSPWCTVSRRILESAPEPERLGPIDAALISHAHRDHLDLPTLAGLERLGELIVPDGAERYFGDERWSGTRVVPLAPGACTAIGELEVCAFEVQHEGNRNHPLWSRIEAVGYVVRAGEDALLFAGDTGFQVDFGGLADRYHPRAAILPIGAWLPRFPMKHYHLSPEEAVQAGQRLGVETVVPCHFGTFTVSLDRPSWALPRFAHAARRAGLSWRMPMLWTRREAGS